MGNSVAKTVAGIACVVVGIVAVAVGAYFGNGYLERQHFGIFQPRAGHVREVPLEDIDLVIVPGVAFDKYNMRLGRGHGYYDRFLSSLPDRTKTIGLAFDFQVVENLPKDSHDIPVSRTIAA